MRKSGKLALSIVAASALLFVAMAVLAIPVAPQMMTVMAGAQISPALAFGAAGERGCEERNFTTSALAANKESEGEQYAIVANLVVGQLTATSGDGKKESEGGQHAIVLCSSLQKESAAWPQSSRG